MKIKLLESFTAVDAHGKKYKIDLFQEHREIRTLNGTDHLPGMKFYACGTSKVTNIDDHTFHIISTDTEVKKVA